MFIDINLYGKAKHAAEIAICDIEKLMRDGNFAVYKVKWSFEHKRGKPYSRIFITNRPEEVREYIFYIWEDRQARLLASRFVSFLDASAKCKKMIFFFDKSVRGELVDFPEPIDFPNTPYLKPYQWEKRLIKLLELLDEEGGQTFEEIRSKIGISQGAVNWLSGRNKSKYWYMGAATQIEANRIKGKHTKHKLVFSITEEGWRRLAFMKRVYGC